jgi:hypothetical protein
MTGYAGFDRSEYPGDAVMKWLLANTNLRWAGFYLSPAPSHQDPSWMKAAEGDGLAGWGLAPIFVGQETIGPGSHLVTAAQGAIDGKAACALMTQAGFAAGSFVYLDLENGPPFSAAQQGYVGAWVDAVVAGGFGPGVYASFMFAAAVKALRPNARIWVFHVRTTSPHSVTGSTFANPDPTTSGFNKASIWQHDDEARIVCPVAPGGVLACDLDSADSEDPSAP